MEQGLVATGDKIEEGAGTAAKVSAPPLQIYRKSNANSPKSSSNNRVFRPVYTRSVWFRSVQYWCKRSSVLFSMGLCGVKYWHVCGAVCAIFAVRLATWMSASVLRAGYAMSVTDKGLCSYQVVTDHARHKPAPK
eukprot:2412290-Rhodomonas_salina.1